MRLFFLILALLLLPFSIVGNSWAATPPDCNIELYPGNDVGQAISNYDRVCLNPGVYELSTTLTLGSGKKLLGKGQFDDSGNNVVLTTVDDFLPIGLITIRDNAKIDNLVIKPKPLTQAQKDSLTIEDIELNRDFVRYGIRNGASFPAHGAIVSRVTIKNVENPLRFVNSNNVFISQVMMDDNGSREDCQGDVALFIQNSDYLTLEDSTVILAEGHDGQIVGDCNDAPEREGKGALDGDGSVACHFSKGFKSINNTHISTATGSYYLNHCDDAYLNRVVISESQGWGIDAGLGGNCDLVVKNTTVQKSGRGAGVLLVSDDHDINDPGCNGDYTSAYTAEFANVDFIDNTNLDTRDPDGDGVENYPSLAVCEGVNKSASVVVNGIYETQNLPTSDLCDLP